MADLSETRSASTVDFPALPPEAPLDMPTQCFRSRCRATGTPATSPKSIFFRRLFVIGGAAAMTVEAAREMYIALGMAGMSLPEFVVLALYVGLFGWIAFAFTSALGGCISLLVRSSPSPVGSESMHLSGLTALLMPTYNESPARIMAGLQAVFESLVAEGVDRHFHIFILSDTTDPDIWIAEEAAFLALRERTGASEQIFYRRRQKNTERKPGNIAEWVKRFGGRYPRMVVLDADSIMTGNAIVRLVTAMQLHPGVGLIQTLPTIVNGKTVFARAQQFAARVYGPVIAEGLSWWQGAEGNYWGHNAVIRTEAFAAAAGLPTLRGPKPFGGAILSHDFVEAALLRRAGWAVHLLPDLGGSYEESPPSLRDLAVRDRRWCQGNLQHTGILGAAGLHWASRLNLLTGIGAYITSPMWLLFLLSGLFLSVQTRFIRPVYFTLDRSLFPDWPHVDPVRSEWVFIGTVIVLLMPKILGYLVVMPNRAARSGCAGALRTFISVILETVITGLAAPVAMLSQSAAVAEILLGRDSGWATQQRDANSMRLGEICCTYALHTMFGVGLGVSAYFISPSLFLWMSPVVLGLTFAIPLVILTGRADLGDALRKLRLLQIPEEQSRPTILRRVAELYSSFNKPTLGAVQALIADSRLRKRHLEWLPVVPSPKHRLEPDLVMGLARLQCVETSDELPAALPRKELTALLGDREGFQKLLAKTSSISSTKRDDRFVA